MTQQLSLFILVLVFILYFVFFRSFVVIRNSTGRLDKERTNLRGLQILSWIVLILAVVLSFTAGITGEKKEPWLWWLPLLMGIMGFQISQVLQSFDNRLAKLESTSSRKEIGEE